MKKVMRTRNKELLIFLRIPETDNEDVEETIFEKIKLKILKPQEDCSFQIYRICQVQNKVNKNEYKLRHILMIPQTMKENKKFKYNN